MIAQQIQAQNPPQPAPQSQLQSQDLINLLATLGATPQ